MAGTRWHYYGVPTPLPPPPRPPNSLPEEPVEWTWDQTGGDIILPWNEHGTRQEVTSYPPPPPVNRQAVPKRLSSLAVGNNVIYLSYTGTLNDFCRFANCRPDNMSRLMNTAVIDLFFRILWVISSKLPFWYTVLLLMCFSEYIA